jgi:hypothetical protein
MSWSLQLVGTRAAVKAALAVNPGIPDGVRAAINEVCDDPKPRHNGVLVKGHGHNNDGVSSESNIGALLVEGVDVAAEPS